MIWDVLRKQKKSLLKPPEIVKKMSEISAHKVASFPDSSTYFLVTSGEIRFFCARSTMEKWV